MSRLLFNFTLCCTRRNDHVPCPTAHLYVCLICRLWGQHSYCASNPIEVQMEARQIRQKMDLCKLESGNVFYDNGVKYTCLYSYDFEHDMTKELNEGGLRTSQGGTGRIRPT